MSDNNGSAPPPIYFLNYSFNVPAGISQMYSQLTNQQQQQQPQQQRQNPADQSQRPPSTPWSMFSGTFEVPASWATQQPSSTAPSDSTTGGGSTDQSGDSSAESASTSNSTGPIGGGPTTGGPTSGGPTWHRMAERAFFFRPNASFPGFSANNQDKTKASSRALNRLEIVPTDQLPESEQSCSICYDKYDPYSQSQADSQFGSSYDDDADPVESTIDEDFPESNPNLDPAESFPESIIPDEECSDPPESVPTDNQNDDSKNQSIFDKAPEHAPIKMPCGHIFGAACIKEWLSKTNTCPLCRTTIESQDEYLRATGQQTTTGSGFENQVLDILMQLLPTVFGAQNNANSTAPPASGPDVNNATPHSTDSATTESNSEHNQTPNVDSDNVPPPPRARIPVFHLAPNGRWRFTNGQTPVPNQDGTYNFVMGLFEGFGRDNEQQNNNGSTQTTPSTPASTENSSQSEPNVNQEMTTASDDDGPPVSVPSEDEPMPSIVDSDPPIVLPQPSSSSGWRESRHHPYSRSRPTESSSNSTSSLRDLQCATVPLGICVEEESQQGANTLVRLECNHGYHVSCLKTCMRLHGDAEIPNLAQTNDGATRDVWCVRCRRYRNVV